MNGGISRKAISPPLSVPKAARRDGRGETGARSGRQRNDDNTSEESVRTAPIERSSPSVMMMSVIGSAIISRMVDCTKTLGLRDRKIPVRSAEHRDQNTSTSATPGMRCSRIAQT